MQIYPNAHTCDTDTDRFRYGDFWQREVDMDIHTQAVVSCWGPASTCGQAELDKLTVAKLKERLSKLGKRTSGNKATLVRRLLEACLS